MCRRKWSPCRQLMNGGLHLGCCSLHQTLSYPRSSWQSLYWAQWQSRAQSVCWSSGSLSGHPLCHSKTQLLCLQAAGHQALRVNSYFNSIKWGRKKKTLQNFHSLLCPSYLLLSNYFFYKVFCSILKGRIFFNSRMTLKRSNSQTAQIFSFFFFFGRSYYVASDQQKWSEH